MASVLRKEEAKRAKSREEALRYAERAAERDALAERNRAYYARKREEDNARPEATKVAERKAALAAALSEHSERIREPEAAKLAQITELFGQIDQDGDGLIDRGEFHKAMTGKRKQQLRALLKVQETETVVWYNRDGDVRWDERTGEDWKAVLKRIDADHDGKVDIQEFITAIHYATGTY